MSDYEPKILAFLCNWCSYAGADQAGGMKKMYPPNVRILRVMCSGRVEPRFILKAFEEGADGVMVCGCHPGDCHYKEGNNKTARRMILMESMLEQFNIEKERFRLEWISAAEGDKFATVANEMTEAVRNLGPLGLKSDAVLDAASGGGAGE